MQEIFNRDMPTTVHILNEETRTKLKSRGEKGRYYVPWNRSKGKNRFQRRVHSRVVNQVKQFNSIDMNKLFKDNILTVNIQVQGETDTYEVRMSVGDVCDILSDELEKNNYVFDLKVCTRAVVTAFNRSNVFIHCSCPDYKFRFEYLNLQHGISSYSKEEAQKTNGIAATDAPNITNPNDDLGSGCKHIMLVLANKTWIMKVASVIKNYVTYVEKHYEQQYADIIYPKLFRHPYDKDVQIELTGSDTLITDKDVINAANDAGAKSTQFKQGNDLGYKFMKNPAKDNVSDDQTSLFNDEEISEEQ